MAFKPSGKRRLLDGILSALALLIASAVGYFLLTLNSGKLVEASATHWSALEDRPHNNQCLATRFRQPASVRLEPLAPAGTFQSPVGVTPLPDSNTVFFVLQQNGEVWRLESKRTDRESAESEFTVERWVDLKERFNIVFRPQGCHECGLYSLAFHPEFQQNGYLYFSFTEGGDGDAPLFSHLVRLRSDDGGKTLVRTDNGELWYESLYQLKQPTHIHNNGKADFGPDGYLYVNMGDGGVSANAQDVTNPYGSILRLTDTGQPAPGNVIAQNGGAAEVYAHGLRNSWNWSFDRKTGALWAGDVGGNRFEELNRIENGGNYGWPCVEGYEPRSDCPVPDNHSEPVWDYGRAQGRSVTGGFVYRGEALPELNGVFIFGDFGSGVIWGLERDADGQLQQRSLLHSGDPIVSFAEDDDGELYVVEYNKGTVSRLLPAEPADDRIPIPERLSDTGCMNPDDLTRPAPGLIGYDLKEPFWSDGASKERYMSLPEHSRVSVADNGKLVFPVGAILVKQFRLKNELIETRLLLNQGQTGWIGYSYEWNKDGSEALLLDAAADIEKQEQLWHYPSTAECAQCHTAAAGHTLGPGVRQMDIDAPDASAQRESSDKSLNQLDHLWSIDVLDRPVAEAMRVPAMPSSRDTSATLEQRARAFLDSNCANCHLPEGTSQSSMDWRFSTPMALTNACGKTPTQTTMGVDGARLIAPGDAERSILWRRIAYQDVYRMPPLGSHRVDRESADLVAQWINSLDGCYTLAGPVTANFSVQNQASGDYLGDRRGRPVLSAQATTLWRVEDGEEHYRLRRADDARAKSEATHYLHAERPRLQVSEIRTTWWSAEWELEPVGEAFRIRNRWKNDHYLQAPANSGLNSVNQSPANQSPVLGPLDQSGDRALWRFEPVQPLESGEKSAASDSL